MNKIPNYRDLTDIPDDLINIQSLVKEHNAQFVSREHIIAGNKILTIDVKLPRYREDKLYNDNNIRSLVPRGLCYVFVNNKYVHTLCGHPKFGNFGDYQSCDISGAKRVFRRKENGECTHWTAFKYNEEIYEVYGSKNVHLVTRLEHFEEDIKLYNDVRYTYAVKMAQAINRLYTKKCIEYMLDTGYTFCGEACFPDSQHIVDYKDVQILFFAITGKRTITDSIVKVNPIDVDKLFSSYGLRNVAETIVPEEIELSSVEKYFETQDNSEGAVVSCLDDKNNVIYVYKHKNYNYIFIRALREQMRKNSSTINIMKRMNRLHIEHPSFDAMIKWGLKFNAWYRMMDNKEKIGFFEQFVTNMNRFNALDDETTNNILTKYNEIEKTTKTLNVIMFVAIPGSGKSFLARSLKAILENLEVDDKMKITHLEQDMFSHKGNKAGKAYDKAIKKEMNDSDITHLILTKSNHCQNVRNKTYDILDNSNKNIVRTYVVMTADDGNMEKTFNICVNRIVERGFAHESLYGKNKTEIESILKDIFIKQWLPLTEDEMSYNIVDIDIGDDKKTIIKSCIEQLQRHEIIPLFEVTDKMIDNAIQIVNKDDEKIAKKNVK